MFDFDRRMTARGQSPLQSINQSTPERMSLAGAAQGTTVRNGAIQVARSP
jgi:hypothetical protein